MSAGIAAIIAIAIGGIVTLLIVGPDIAYRRDDIPAGAQTPHATVHRHPPQRRWAEDPPTALVIVPYTHAAPARPFTVPQAHAVMQQHLHCTPRICARKREAGRALVEAGVMQPRKPGRRIRQHA